MRYLLVVDDEPMITSVYRRYFEARGYVVATAVDGHIAPWIFARNLSLMR